MAMNRIEPLWQLENLFGGRFERGKVRSPENAGFGYKTLFIDGTNLIENRH
jgi:hypothetical protein